MVLRTNADSTLSSYSWHVRWTILDTGLNPGLLCAKQAPFLLYYLSSPTWTFLKVENLAQFQCSISKSCVIYILTQVSMITETLRKLIKCAWTSCWNIPKMSIIWKVVFRHLFQKFTFCISEENLLPITNG